MDISGNKNKQNIWPLRRFTSYAFQLFDSALEFQHILALIPVETYQYQQKLIPVEIENYNNFCRDFEVLMPYFQKMIIENYIIKVY